MLETRQALFQKLSATSGVTSRVSSRIYHGQAPSDATYPLVIFNQMPGTKDRAFQNPNAFIREVWLVKCVDRNTTSNVAEAVKQAVDAALDGGTLTVTGKVVTDLHHVSDVDYVEPVDDQTYRHHGATYEVVLTSP